MDINPDTLSALGKRLMTERKRQGLSRSQAAAVCNVSTSFIRDAELDPGRCSLGRLQQLTGGLGLALTLTGWQGPDSARNEQAGSPTRAPQVLDKT